MIHHYFLYLKVKKVWPCFVCRKMINVPRHYHFCTHQREGIFIATHSKFLQFSCYDEFMMCSLSMAKNAFEIENILNYILLMDKMFNDIVPIVTLFGSVGVCQMENNFTVFEDGKKSGMHYVHYCFPHY
jgi:hypothetical protein